MHFGIQNKAFQFKKKKKNQGLNFRFARWTKLGRLNNTLSQVRMTQNVIRWSSQFYNAQRT